MNNLPQFRDIQIPDGVSIFPIAYGWWVLLCVIVFLFLFIKFFIAFWKTRRKYYSLKKLENISTDNPIQAAVAISELLRRISLIKDRKSCVLTGKEWIDFLNRHASHHLSQKSADFLSFAPFMNSSNQTYTPEDAIDLKKFCKNWIGENL